MGIKVGDIVARKSYSFDILFKVYDIAVNKDGSRTIYLKGLNYRLVADAPESDLVIMPMNRVNEENSLFEKRISKLSKKDSLISGYKLGRRLFVREGNNVFEKSGKVLHIDGDNDYLNMCMKYYKEQGISAVGKLVKEEEQPKQIIALLMENTPDIVVITGHDSMSKAGGTGQGSKDYHSLDRYKNSRYFIDSVREARKYQHSMDELVIFAGACQSYFEGILGAGANFASSPGRILIHALDPGMVSRHIAFTPIDKVASAEEVIKGTITGLQGIGGVQTRGKLRSGMPRSLYTP